MEFDETINLNPTDGMNYLNRARVYFDLELYKVHKIYLLHSQLYRPINLINTGYHIFYLSSYIVFIPKVTKFIFNNNI